MGIWIEDSKTKAVRHYSTTRKIEKAIETLLQEMDIMSCGFREGYEVTIKEIQNDRD